MSIPISISGSLLCIPETIDTYQEATEAPFLRLAGQGRLELEKLSQWLAQDRLYAQAYCRFVGALISRIHLPYKTEQSTKSLEFRTITILQSALTGILRELEFFETTAKKYNIKLASDPSTFGPNLVTQKYIDLFDSFHTPREAKRSFMEGMVLIWATEKLYLDAWTYASKQTDPKTAGSADEYQSDLDGGALRKEFIPNWTSKEFVGFVEDLEGCMNEWGTLIKKQSTAEDVEGIALSMWKQVLDLELGFWPVV